MWTAWGRLTSVRPFPTFPEGRRWRPSSHFGPRDTPRGSVHRERNAWGSGPVQPPAKPRRARPGIEIASFHSSKSGAAGEGRLAQSSHARKAIDLRIRRSRPRRELAPPCARRALHPKRPLRLTRPLPGGFLSRSSAQPISARGVASLVCSVVSRSLPAPAHSMQMRRSRERSHWLLQPSSAHTGRLGRSSTRPSGESRRERRGRCAGRRLAARRLPDPADWPLRSRNWLVKGMKRKWSEEEAGPPAATPCSSLFSLSVSKLHQSLQHVEPNLRHLVLVANTLRRFQGEMQPVPAPVPQATSGQEDPSPEGSSFSLPSTLACNLFEPSWRLLSPPSLSPHADELLLSNADSCVVSTFWEDSSDIAQPEGPQLCLFSPEAEWTSHPCPSSTLDLLSSSGCLLEDGLEGVFGDIDTSMYDCDLWLPTSLPNFKEAFCSPGEPRPDLADLDCLMDVLVGVQDL